MKKTTQDILNWFSNLDYENQLGAFKASNPNYVEFETSIEEVILTFSNLKQKLLIAIEAGKLDDFSFNKRNQILAYLNNIAVQLKQLQRFNFMANQPIARQQSQALINNLFQLSDLVDSSIGPFDVIQNINTKELTKELLNIKNKYEALVKKIVQVEQIFNESINRSQEITNTSKSLVNSVQVLDQALKSTNNLKIEIEKNYNKITQTAQDVEGKRVTISSLFNNAKELTKIIETSDAELRKTILNLEKTNDSSIAKQRDTIQTKLKSFEKETREIIDKNKELQSKVNNLLEGANAGRLYKSFHWRKLQLEKKQWIWIAGIIIINVLIVAFTFLIINGSVGLGIKGLNVEKIDSAFLMKLFLTIPLLFLDWFFLRQYNINKDLIENYAYKSVISTSLLAYNQMIKEHVEDKNALDFLIKTVDKIYSNPLEQKDLNKNELELVKEIAEKGIDKLAEIAKNTTKSFTKQ
jgi:hypothetical protein